MSKKAKFPPVKRFKGVINNYILIPESWFDMKTYMGFPTTNVDAIPRAHWNDLKQLGITNDVVKSAFATAPDDYVVSTETYKAARGISLAWYRYLAALLLGLTTEQAKSISLRYFYEAIQSLEGESISNSYAFALAYAKYPKDVCSALIPYLPHLSTSNPDLDAAHHAWKSGVDPNLFAAVLD